MGEHLPCKQRVMGSNPIISTKVQTEKMKVGSASTAGTKETKPITTWAHSSGG